MFSLKTFEYIFCNFKLISADVFTIDIVSLILYVPNISKLIQLLLARVVAILLVGVNLI